MGLGGFLLGGALAGAGKGMALQAEQSALERREARLAAARAAERQEDRTWRKEDLQQAEDSTARRDKRLHGYDVEKEGVRFSNQVTLADKSDATTLERDRLNHTRDMEKLEKEWGFRMSDAEKDRTFRTEQELGKPVDAITDEATGERILIYNDPNQKSGVRRVRITGVDARKPKTTGSGTSLLTNRGAGEDPAPTSVNSGKILTRAQLAEAAKAQGKSETQMEAEAKRLGFTIR